MMLKDPSSKYRHFTTVDLPDRQWPHVVQAAAPTLCSIDMHDGNQALIEPMNAERKHRFFYLLARVGCKEIEVGFTAESLKGGTGAVNRASRLGLLSVMSAAVPS